MGLLIKRLKLALGFSLIEVMAALAVISIGSLGYIKSQTLAVKSVVDLQLMTYAEILVDHMVNKIQANSAMAARGTASSYLFVPQTFIDASYSACFTSTLPSCHPYYLAITELYEWNALINNPDNFPSVAGAIGRVCLESPVGQVNLPNTTCGTAVNMDPMVYTVKIYWKSMGSSVYDQVIVGTAPVQIDRQEPYR